MMSANRAMVAIALVLTLTVLTWPDRWSFAGTIGEREVMVTARTLQQFKVGSSQTQFGPFEFVGGLELSSNDDDFGSMSAIRFDDGGRHFVGVSDTGFWYGGVVERDSEHRPVAIREFRLAPLLDSDGSSSGKKSDSDAEGLALRDGLATVGLERVHRVVNYRFNPPALPGKALGTIDLVMPVKELRSNKGIETVAYSPRESALKGARIIISERSLDTRGNIFAAIVEGPNRGVFFVRRHDDFDITDGAFLPNGDLLLLERHFSMARGVLMRLRRIEKAVLRPGNTVDGTVLLTVGMSHQIDNMEGLDVWENENGQTMISLISDDNQSILQRSIYLEFKLTE